MNMASFGILTFTVICLFQLPFISAECTAKSVFLKVGCKAEKMVQYGQQALLECIIHPTHKTEDTEIKVVTWKKDGGPLLVFHGGETIVKQGYSFAEPSWDVKNMNVSLLIANTAVEHQGVYECEVVTDRGSGCNSTNLKVTAKYNKPTIRSDPEKLALNTAGTLTCDSDGGYPKGEIRWIDEHKTDWTDSSEMVAKPTSTGLFHLSSKLTLKPASTFPKYTCVVFNASGGKEEEVTFELLDPSKQEVENLPSKAVDISTKIAAPAVVIGSLIVGLLMALLIHRKRSRSVRRESSVALMSGNRMEHRASDVEEGNLQQCLNEVEK